jgi:ribonuclease P protein component
MLKKARRLPIQAVLKLRATKRVVTEHLVAYRYAAGAPHARLGVAVAKKVSPSAVRRNALRRAVYEAANSLLARTPPRDILIRVLREPRAASRDTVAQEVARLLAQL